MPIVNDCPTTARVGRKHGDQRQHRTNNADNHQNDAYFVDVEPVLVGTHSHRVIENGPYRKGDDARDKSSSSNHLNLLLGCNSYTHGNGEETADPEDVECEVSWPNVEPFDHPGSQSVTHMSSPVISNTR